MRWDKNRVRFVFVNYMYSYYIILLAVSIGTHPQFCSGVGLHGVGVWIRTTVLRG